MPLPLSTKLIPEGSEPVSVNEGDGIPEVVTLKVEALPAMKVVVLLLVIAGAWVTNRVKL